MHRRITHKRLKQLLRYRPRKGDFVWLVDGLQPIGSSGFRGVTIKARLRKPYVAQVSNGRGKRHLGCFATGDAAERAYLCAAIRSIKGKVAGCRNSDGYWRIKIGKVEYAAHHLAVFYVTGRWPKHYVDHRDLDKGNNRWSNLREATASQNAANKRSPKRFKGVIDKSPFLKKRYYASITVNGKRIGLGYFYTEEAAHAAYCKAARQYFGAFARAA